MGAPAQHFLRDAEAAHLFWERGGVKGRGIVDSRDLVPIYTMRRGRLIASSLTRMDSLDEALSSHR